MKQALAAPARALIRGVLIVVPVYLAVLLLLKGMKSLATLVHPFTQVLPDWMPAEDLLSLLLVLAICAAIGAYVGTGVGRRARNSIERAIFERIPGYALFRSLANQMAGQSRESTWKAALFRPYTSGAAGTRKPRGTSVTHDPSLQPASSSISTPTRIGLVTPNYARENCIANQRQDRSASSQHCSSIAH